jgi:hypothetical protein
MSLAALNEITNCHERAMESIFSNFLLPLRMTCEWFDCKKELDIPQQDGVMTGLPEKTIARLQCFKNTAEGLLDDCGESSSAFQEAFSPSVELTFAMANQRACIQPQPIKFTASTSSTDLENEDPDKAKREAQRLNSFPCVHTSTHKNALNFVRARHKLTVVWWKSITEDYSKQHCSPIDMLHNAVSHVSQMPVVEILGEQTEYLRKECARACDYILQNQGNSPTGTFSLELKDDKKAASEEGSVDTESRGLYSGARIESDRQVTKGFFSATQLYESNDVPEFRRKAFLRAVNRERDKLGLGSDYIEHDAPAKNEPRFYYREEAILGLIERYK